MNNSECGGSDTKYLQKFLKEYLPIDKYDVLLCVMWSSLCVKFLSKLVSVCMCDWRKGVVQAGDRYIVNTDHNQVLGTTALCPKAVCEQSIPEARGYWWRA